MAFNFTSVFGTDCEFVFDKKDGSPRLVEDCCNSSAADELASFLALSDIRALFFASHNSLPFDSALCNLFLPAGQERLW